MQGKIQLAGLVAMAVFLAGCYHGGEQTNEVTMEGTAFSPAEIEIPVGTTVTWTNEATLEHTTTSDDGEWDSGLLGEGDTFEHTFDAPGTYTYHCIPHEDQGMRGTIVVTEE